MNRDYWALMDDGSGAAPPTDLIATSVAQPPTDRPANEALMPEIIYGC